MTIPIPTTASITGSVFLVSGAASGIGSATARRLASEGATVYGADISHPEVVVPRPGGDRRYHPVHLDVRDAHAWERLVATIVDYHGRLDGLANVAGIVNRVSPDTITELTEQAWDAVLDTNLKGTWFGMRAAIPAMQQQDGGRIVNIASMAAELGIPGVASYAASKGGVIALTRQAAMEYGDDGILVNAVCPGTIDTPIFGDAPTGAKQNHSRAHIVSRLGTAEEVASMVRYLLGEGGFITGATLAVDGGWSAKGSR